MATTNILISTLPGLSLPQTLSLPLPSTTSLSSLFSILSDRLQLPSDTQVSHLRLSTTTGKLLSPSSTTTTLASLSANNDLLTLRLTAPLLGGKGGFGSQLRAAGGRMSSRKRKGQENNDSCRNLDGRRMRTVKEAKALAQYLETRPEMDQKEKQQRRERWEKVVEAADEGIKAGGMKAKNQKFDDEAWLEEKDEARDRARAAVIKAMKAGAGMPSPPGMESGKSETSEELEARSGEGSDNKSSGEDEAASAPVKRKKKSNSEPQFFGFEEDEEFMSSSDEEDLEDVPEEEEEDDRPTEKGKGKAIAA